LHYLPRPPNGWTPRALTCSTQTGKGIAELWKCVLEQTDLTKANGWFSVTRRDQTRRWMHEIIEQGLRQRFESHPAIRKRMEALEQDVLEGRTTSFRAARTLLEIYAEPKPAESHSGD
jgi:LAO/AO transport system kinase